MQTEAARPTRLRDLLAPVVRGRRRQLVAIAFLAFLNGLADAAILVIVARVAFALTESSGQVTVGFGPIDRLTFTIESLIAIAAGVVVVKFASQLVVARMSSRLAPAYVLDHRKRVVGAFLRASWALQSDERQGHLQDLVTSYTMQSANALTSLITLGVAACSLIGLLGAAIAIDALGAIVAGIAVAVLAIAFRPLRTHVRAASRRVAQKNIEFATATTEVAGQAQEIRVFGVPDAVRRRLEVTAEQHSRAYQKLQFLNQALTSVYQNTALILLLGALLVVSAVDASNLAALGGVVLILLRALSYGQTGMVAYYALNQQAPILERLREEEARFAAAAVTTSGAPVSAIDTLGFDTVSFAYAGDRSVLQDLSFSTRRGEIIGIVGPSGAGKSTLVQLILRLREPSTGRILADGRAVNELSLDDWYRLVAFVPQEPRLFAGTVAENIQFFRSDVDRGQIETAARLAHIHDEIVRRPGGYDSSVGERGAHLSGGQRQRLCIARALVGQPHIVVFDEPTSSLDVRSESLIREALVELSDRATVFIVAHRMSTLDICDRIMVLQEGELRGFDQPEQLEISNPFYAEALQLSGLR